MKKYILGLITASVMLFSSCAKDYLDTKPGISGSIETENVYANFDFMEKAMVGIYFTKTNAAMGVGYRGEAYFNYMNDIYAGTVSLNDRNQFLFDAYAFNTAYFSKTESNDASFPWNICYGQIKEVNVLLKAIENFDRTNLTGTQLARMTHMKAELLTLRGFNYFRLNSYFAWGWNEGTAHTDLSVPLRLEYSLEALPRETTLKIMESVETDYLDALALFNEVDGKYIGTLPEVATANINVLRMFLSRYYLYIGLNDEGLNYAEEVINKSGKKLMGTSLYYTGFNDSNNQEWIWGGLSNAEGSGYASFFSLFGSNFLNGYNSEQPFALDSRYLNFVASKDTRKSVDGDGRTSGIFVLDSDDGIKNNGVKYYFDRQFIPSEEVVYLEALYKGASRKFRQLSSGTQVGDGDVVYMRLAEAYYLAAEAAYLMGDETKAKGYLEDVVKPYNSEYTAPANGSSLYEAIKNYKIFDMYGEGRGFEDFKRRGTVVDRSGQPLVANKSVPFAKYGPKKSDPYAQVFTLQILRSSIEVNPLLERNEY